MTLTSTEKIDVLNIGLMLFSCCIAIVIPFELFLVVYAILGPLHYLTEISWLHDRNYFSKGKYDAPILILIGLLLTAFQFKEKITAFIDISFPEFLNSELVYIALLGSLIFATVKNNFYRIAGLVLLIITSSLSHHAAIFFTIFLPTLVHVYIFTGLFMLYGALKSKSRTGLIAVLSLALCPFILYNVYPNTFFHPISVANKSIYDEFFKVMNVHSLLHIFHYPPLLQTDPKANPLSLWDNIIYHSQGGIMLMRFIAFAYTYHYLNWFSKTKIIQWHRVPKVRFAAVIILWLVSIGLYLVNYSSGLQWLFFLSFLHVLLEFPLNFTSIIGIGKSIGERFKPASAN